MAQYLLSKLTLRLLGTNSTTGHHYSMIIVLCISVKDLLTIMFSPLSHPFCVKLLTLCKEEIRKSKDIQKLRSSIAV